MLSLRLLLPVVALGFTLAQPSTARAESPLERVHKKIFGDDDKKKDEKKKDDKKKDKDHKHDRDDYRYDGSRYDNGRYYRNDPVIVERRVYVEPAPRPYYYENRYEPAPRYYDSRSLEMDVQRELRRRGYYYGPIDGDIGPGTRSAIRDYQYDRRLPVTGRIDTYLVRSLGL